ncbi:MAG: hypothetical protein M1817_004358 [Caeruleum heppii]|nr:MAG: hypothetical protein M1817_004358 [Caeruleum heppii]
MASNAPPSATTHWLSGYGLSRPVLQSQIRLYLGPKAFEQINDIRRESEKYEKQASASMSGNLQESFINRPVPIRQREASRR